MIEKAENRNINFGWLLNINLTAKEKNLVLTQDISESGKKNQHT